MIQLLSVRLENFLSHRDTFLDMSKKSDLVLIEGKNYDGRYDSNGSGKSSILEALVYALSGNTLRGVGVADVVNRQAGKDTKVTLEMTVDGVRYRVERHRAHTTQGDSLLLFKDGEDISKRLNKDTQVLLDSIVGVPYNVLISVLFLGEGLSAKFTQLSDPDKKAIIESSLSLSHDFNAVREKVNKELKGVKSTRDTESGRSAGIQRVLDGIDPSDNISPDVIARVTSDLEDKTSSYAQLYKSYQDLSSKVSTVDKAIQDFERSIKVAQEYDHKIVILGDQIKTIYEKPDPTCSLCHQTLSSDEAKRSSVEGLEAQIASIQEWRKPLEESLSRVRDIETTKEMSYRLHNDLVASNETLQRVYKEVSDLSLLKSSLEAKQSVYSQLATYQSDLDEIKGILVKLDVSLSDLNYLYGLFSPTGLIVSILEESVQYINDRLKLYSEVLLDKSYLIVFKKGKISLLDSCGSTYQSLSNGEKRRLDIAIQFSLHDYVTTYCGKGIDTIFIDEVLDTLDSVGVRNIIEVLRMKLEYCNADRIFLITHNNDIKSQVDSFITVVKNSEGISTLLEEVNHQ